MTTVGEIIDRVRFLLREEDIDVYRWTDEELILWLNDAQRAIVKIDLFANPQTVDFTLSRTTGARQVIPQDGVGMIDVVRNSSATQAPYAGRPITRITKESYDLASKQAYGAVADTSGVFHYYYEPNNRYQFYVYPAPAPTGADIKVEMVYAKIPDKVSGLEDEISLRDFYIDSITDFILYKAYLKDRDYASKDLAVAYHNSFLRSMGAVGGEK